MYVGVRIFINYFHELFLIVSWNQSFSFQPRAPPCAMTAKMTSETNIFFSFQLSEHTRMEHVFEIQETEVGRNVVIGGNLGVEDTYLQKEYEDGGVATYASEELSSRCFKFLNEDGNSDVIVNGLANLDQVADLPKAQGRLFEFLPIFIQVKTNKFDKKKRNNTGTLKKKGCAIMYSSTSFTRKM